jgi:RND family efflux transporter MFP subunit
VDELFGIGLYNAAWATGLALVAAVGSRVFRRRPGLVHTLWLLVLLKLVTPSLVSVSHPWSLPATADGRITGPPTISPRSASSPKTGSSLASTVTRPIAPTRETTSAALNAVPDTAPSRTAVRSTAHSWPWQWLLAVVWLAGAVLWWGFVGLSLVRFRRLFRSSVPAPTELHDRVCQAARELGLAARRVPVTGIVPARVPPLVWATLASPPRLLLPQELWGRLDEPQQNAVLAHELAHLKRGDHWVRWLEAVVLGFYWWDPVAWYARRRIERAEEESCDAWVVWSQPGAAGSYAEALLATTAFLSGVNRPLPLGASGAGSTFALKRRLEMILSDVADASVARSRSTKLLIIALGFLPLLPVMGSGKAQQAFAGVPVEQTAGASAQTKEKPEEAPARSSGGLKAADRARVRVIRPVVRWIADYHDLEPGPLQPSNRVELKVQLGGVLQKVSCKPGQRVKRGEVLFELDARSFELELQKAEAEVKRLESRVAGIAVQRANTGRDGLAPLESSSGEAKATLLGLQADRDLARLRLESTKVVAPFDGVISRVVHGEGTLVGPGSAELGTIISDNSLSAQFYVQESTARQLNVARNGGPRSGVAVRIGVRDEDGFPHEGLIDFIDRQVQPQFDQVRIGILVPNPDGSLNPGLFARAQIQVGPAHDAVLLPNGLISDRDRRRFIDVLTDDRIVVRRFIQVGERVDDLRVVERGLKADEWVIAGGPGVTLGSKLNESDIAQPVAQPEKPLPR